MLERSSSTRESGNVSQKKKKRPKKKKGNPGATKLYACFTCCLLLAMGSQSVDKYVLVTGNARIKGPPPSVTEIPEGLDSTPIHIHAGAERTRAVLHVIEHT